MGARGHCLENMITNTLRANEKFVGANYVRQRTPDIATRIARQTS